MEPTAVAKVYALTKGDRKRMGGQESENAPNSESSSRARLLEAPYNKSLNSRRASICYKDRRRLNNWA